jgi:hypothetical protein
MPTKKRDLRLLISNVGYWPKAEVGSAFRELALAMGGSSFRPRPKPDGQRGGRQTFNGRISSVNYLPSPLMSISDLGPKHQGADGLARLNSDSARSFHRTTPCIASSYEDVKSKLSTIRPPTPAA